MGLAAILEICGPKANLEATQQYRLGAMQRDLLLQGMIVLWDGNSIQSKI